MANSEFTKHWTVALNECDPGWILIGRSGSRAELYLQDDGDDDERSDACHHAAEVGEEGLTASTVPDVELLHAEVVVVVGGVIGQVMLDAGARGAGVTAAERDAVHQVLPLHVTEDTTAGQSQSQQTLAAAPPSGQTLQI